MMGDAYGEGINGHYYCEEMDFNGEYDSVRRFKKPFIKNSLYYFVRLFDDNERPNIIYETEKAILFEVEKGQFWVPKKLMRVSHTMVHRSFHRTYLKTNRELTVIELLVMWG